MTFPIAPHVRVLAEMTEKFDWLYLCLWIKHHFAYAQGSLYQQQHEPILIFRRKGKKAYFNVPNNKSTLFTYPKPVASPDHPTPKPVGLWKELVSYHSKRGSDIWEPFLGSGTTILACEELERRCVAVEREPIYCDLSIQRWEQLTGGKARLLSGSIRKNGKKVA